MPQSKTNYELQRQSNIWREVESDTFQCRERQSPTAHAEAGEKMCKYHVYGIFDKYQSLFFGISDIFAIAKAFFGPFDHFGCSITL